MTKSVGVHEAKTHLSRLLDDALAGEDVVITRRGRGARLVPVRARRTPIFGMDEGKLVIPDDFDRSPLPPEIQQFFE